MRRRRLHRTVCSIMDKGVSMITLKLEPVEGDYLRRTYEDIIPGYYMNKVHWNSIKADGAVPDELLMDLCDKSYGLVFGGLSKKVREAIQ